MTHLERPSRQQQQADSYARIAAAFPPGDRTLSTLLTRQAEKYRDRPLVTCGDARWSFEQTARIAETYARYLAHAGVAAGDRVAIHSGNRAEFLQIYLGCAWLGAIATPINTAFRGAQLAHVMNNAEPKLLVVESGFLPVYDELPEGTRVPGLIWRIEDDQIVTSRRSAPTSATWSLAPPPAKRWPFSTPPAPPARRKACAARRRRCSGGACIRRARWACARAMC